jgi:uncharacterized repeat protein (TIGR01451 family)
VDKGDTNISINPVTANLNQETIITGNLNDSSSGLSNKTVTININNVLGQENISENITTNANGEFNYTFTPEYAGEYNITTIFDGDNDYKPSYDSINFTVNPPKYDAVINKTVNVTNPNIGDFIKYTITVTNLEDPQTVNVTDILDNKLIYNSSNPSKGNYDYNTGLWDNIGELTANQTVSLDIIVKVNGSGEISNLATLNTSKMLPIESQVVNINVNPPTNYDAEINKTVNVTNPNFGDLIKYTITVKNLEDPQIVNVTDILDNRLIYISSNPSIGSYNYNTGLWDIGELATNQSVNLDIIVEVNGSGKIANLATLYTLNMSPQDFYANITVNPHINPDKPHINPDKPHINPDGYNFDLKNTGIPILVFLVLISIICGTIYRKRK